MVIDPEHDRPMVPHPYDCFDWWWQRGFEVRYDTGLASMYAREDIELALERRTGKGIHEYKWIEYYKFKQEIADMMTTLMYEGNQSLEFAWRVATRLC